MCSYYNIVCFSMLMLLFFFVLLKTVYYVNDNCIVPHCNLKRVAIFLSAEINFREIVEVRQ